MNKKKTKNYEEFTKKEIKKLIQDLQQFEENFYIAIAGTNKFDILPVTTKSGKLLTKEQLSLIKKETLRLGIKILYCVELDKVMLLLNPENMKIGYIVEGTSH
jgi:hypothetical protein